MDIQTQRILDDCVLERNIWAESRFQFELDYSGGHVDLCPLSTADVLKNVFDKPSEDAKYRVFVCNCDEEPSKRHKKYITNMLARMIVNAVYSKNRLNQETWAFSNEDPDCPS